MTNTRLKSTQSLRVMSNLICFGGSKEKRIEASSTNFLNKFIGFDFLNPATR